MLCRCCFIPISIFWILFWKQKTPTCNKSVLICTSCLSCVIWSRCVLSSDSSEETRDCSRPLASSNSFPIRTDNSRSFSFWKWGFYLECVPRNCSLWVYVYYGSTWFDENFLVIGRNRLINLKRNYVAGNTHKFKYPFQYCKTVIWFWSFFFWWSVQQL